MQIARRGARKSSPGSATVSQMTCIRFGQIGPILSRHILTFAAKLGFALHFEMTGNCIPPAGGVQVIVVSRIVRQMKGDIPQELFDLLPSLKKPASRTQERRRPIQIFVCIGRARAHALFSRRSTPPLRLPAFRRLTVPFGLKVMPTQFRHISARRFWSRRPPFPPTPTIGLSRYGDSAFNSNALSQSPPPYHPPPFCLICRGMPLRCATPRGERDPLWTMQ